VIISKSKLRVRCSYCAASTTRIEVVTPMRSSEGF